MEKIANIDVFHNTMMEEPTVVFCAKKMRAEWLAEELRKYVIKVSCLHGDMLMEDREKNLK